MKHTWASMGMPISVEIIAARSLEPFEIVAAYFREVDERFSTYKPDSEISRINRGELSPEAASAPMREVLALAQETARLTNGFFDIKRPDGSLDPSGLVKGWAISNAAALLRGRGYEDFCVEAGGDLEAWGINEEGVPWRIGIRNPLHTEQIVKVLAIRGRGVATSGAYERGVHIYDPHNPQRPPEGVASVTVIAPSAYEADRLATASFAMGRAGIEFLERLPGVEAYQIGIHGTALMTGGFSAYVV